MTNCRYHCSSCGLHFVSLDAFDYHRVGSFPKGTRRCRPPETAKRRDGTPRLRVVERDGACAAYGARAEPVDVWGEA